MRNMLRSAAGGSQSWNPGQVPQLPADHPWYGRDFGPRLAFEQSPAYWYSQFRTWYRVNGRAFFVNYWYATLVCVDTASLDLVERMPDPYASMSHFEYFAEIYALYFDLDDPLRPNLPQNVMDWLRDNIGVPDAAAPSPARPKPLERWEAIDHPPKPDGK